MKVNFKKISVHDKPEHSPGFLLWHVSFSWRRLIEKSLEELDLTHPQFVILATLGWLTRDGKKTTQAALGKMAGLDPNTTSQIVKGLEKKILVERKDAKDGRAKNPFLTAKGKAVLEKAMPLVENVDTTFFKNLTKKETSEILKLFQKLTL